MHLAFHSRLELYHNKRKQSDPKNAWRDCTTKFRASRSGSTCLCMDVTVSKLITSKGITISRRLPQLIQARSASASLFAGLLRHLASFVSCRPSLLTSTLCLACLLRHRSARFEVRLRTSFYFICIGWPNCPKNPFSPRARAKTLASSINLAGRKAPSLTFFPLLYVGARRELRILHKCFRNTRDHVIASRRTCVLKLLS